MYSLRALLVVAALPLAAAPADGLDSASGACALLTGEEVAELQEAVVLDATPSEQARDGLAISRCFYRTADYSRSVHLELARRDAASDGAVGPAARWRELFADAAEPGAEAPRKSRRVSPAGSQEPPPADDRGETVRVPGLGDEAYFVGTAVYGALYVLRADAYLRLSVGGPGELESKLARARALAERALARPW